MLKKIAKKFFYLVAFWGLQSFNMQAGAIMQLHKVRLPEKTIILFGEIHQGLIENTSYDATYVAQRQQPALSTLFQDFTQMKSNVGIHIECCDAMKEALIDFQQQNPGRIFDYPSTFFDHFYSRYAHDQESPYLSSINNFDSRQPIETCLLFLARAFDEFLDGYRASGYNPEYFAKAKQEFFESDEYQLFIEESPEWHTAILNRLQNIEDNFRRFLPVQNFENIMNLIDARTKNLAALILLKQKAAFMNKNIFQLLFDFAEFSKNDFFNLLKSDSFFASEDIAFVWSLFDVINLFVDLRLIENVLNDQHPIVLVHCGFQHTEYAMEYFFQEYAQHTDVLDLLTEEYLNDANHCYRAMRQFIYLG